MRFTPQDEQFRAEVRAWLDANLAGEFAGLRGAGGPGREHERYDERLAWNRHLAAAGWTCLGWPAEFGGRGAAMLGLQVGFRRELANLVEAARNTAAGSDPLIRDKLARAWVGLEAVRAYALDTLGGDDATEASVLKILWSRWHRDLGELAMEVLGAPSMIASGEPYDLDEWQRLFLFSRADTIYGGSDEIQRTIIAERALGLPRQARS